MIKPDEYYQKKDSPFKPELSVFFSYQEILTPMSLEPMMKQSAAMSAS